VFGGAEPIDASVTAFGLTCPSPPVDGRPGIPDDKDHVLVPLSVRSSETNKDFVSRNFAYYDCARHTTCRDCVKSQWACNWCVYENKCTHNTSSCQRTIISGENVSILEILQQVSTNYLFISFFNILMFQFYFLFFLKLNVLQCLSMLFYICLVMSEGSNSKWLLKNICWTCYGQPH
jgi:hypothetical protein